MSKTPDNLVSEPSDYEKTVPQEWLCMGPWKGSHDRPAADCSTWKNSWRDSIKNWKISCQRCTIQCNVNAKLQEVHRQNQTCLESRVDNLLEKLQETQTESIARLESRFEAFSKMMKGMKWLHKFCPPYTYLLLPLLTYTRRAFYLHRGTRTMGKVVVASDPNRYRVIQHHLESRYP